VSRLLASLPLPHTRCLNPRTHLHQCHKSTEDSMHSSAPMLSGSWCLLLCHLLSALCSPSFCLSCLNQQNQTALSFLFVYPLLPLQLYHQKWVSNPLLPSFLQRLAQSSACDVQQIPKDNLEDPPPSIKEAFKQKAPMTAFLSFISRTPERVAGLSSSHAGTVLSGAEMVQRRMDEADLSGPPWRCHQRPQVCGATLLHLCSYSCHLL